MKSPFICALALIAISVTVAGCGKPEEKPKLRQYAGTEPLCASHILVMHKDSQGAPESMTRTKEDAAALIVELAKKAKAKDADFAALAEEHSEGPSAKHGGMLGVFQHSDMTKPFSDAVVKLALGEISDPVESEFGFHIILRHELPRGNPLEPSEDLVSAKHILIMWKGSQRSESANVTRTKAEALTLIKEVQAKLKNGQRFEELAKKFSDGPSKKTGGDLGSFNAKVMDPGFSKVAFNLEVETVSNVVETPFGYHLIYRYK
jgi:peptidyl-prolyl cis-trans isomerase C